MTRGTRWQRRGRSVQAGAGFGACPGPRLRSRSPSAGSAGTRTRPHGRAPSPAAASAPLHSDVCSRALTIAPQPPYKGDLCQPWERPPPRTAPRSLLAHSHLATLRPDSWGRRGWGAPEPGPSCPAQPHAPPRLQPCVSPHPSDPGSAPAPGRRFRPCTAARQVGALRAAPRWHRLGAPVPPLGAAAGPARGTRFCFLVNAGGRVPDPRSGIWGCEWLGSRGVADGQKGSIPPSTLIHPNKLRALAATRENFSGAKGSQRRSASRLRALLWLHPGIPGRLVLPSRSLTHLLAEKTKFPPETCL